MAGHPLKIDAFAMPKGDRETGIDGPAVRVLAGRTVQGFARADAARLHQRIGEALRAFELAETQSERERQHGHGG